ncbi:MAG: M90 family metallopeptidase [bacterium]
MDLIIAALVTIPVLFFVRWIRRDRRRRILRSTPFPAEWESLLKESVALYRILPESLKPELHGHINVLLDEKAFEGCGGLAITEEMKVVIAAQACILLLKRTPRYFPRVDAILVYPSAYFAEQSRAMGPVRVNEQSVRLGESWVQGLVVLAWDHVEQRFLDVRGGHNVVLHEFAHQLDQEDGHSDGTPVIRDREVFDSWVRVMSREFTALKDKAERGAPDVLDSYGATNEAEFFAVATETFFEKPREFGAAHPELYQVLKSYYRLDPAQWQS